jgi:ribosomal protein S18 acetylase RimI-like enzyme
MNLKITNSTENINWELVSTILAKAGLSSSEPEICKRAFLGSQVTVFAFDDENMVGTARAISDGVKQAAIYDVAILPEYQGKGIGKIMMESIMNKLQGCNFILYANVGKEGFYEKLGFKRLKTGMAKFVKPEIMASRGFTE